MAKQKRKQNDPYRLNRQLERAFNWLRSMKLIHNAAELASKWEKSQATVSCYLKMKRPLGAANAATFEKQFLKRHQLALEDFATPILIDQAELAGKPSNKEVNAIVITKLLVLESGQELLLEKLEKIYEELRTLSEFVTKK